MKSFYTMIIDRKAYCEQCNKTWYGKKAHANGFKHANKSNHAVIIDTHVKYFYNFKWQEGLHGFSARIPQ